MAFIWNWRTIPGIGEKVMWLHGSCLMTAQTKKIVCMTLTISGKEERICILFLPLQQNISSLVQWWWQWSWRNKFTQYCSRSWSCCMAEGSPTLSVTLAGQDRINGILYTPTVDWIDKVSISHLLYPHFSISVITSIIISIRIYYTKLQKTQCCTHFLIKSHMYIFQARPKCFFTSTCSPKINSCSNSQYHFLTRTPQALQTMNESRN